MAHFTRLPQEIHLSIIRILTDDKENSWSSLLSLKLVDRTLLNAFRENEGGIYKAFASRLPSEALEFLEMMRPGALSPCQKNYVVHVIESEMATRLSILDPEDGKYTRAANEFHEWKKASFDSTLDARPGWIGKNELWYIKQSRWVFVDDYVALVGFMALPRSRPDHGDLRERERERIETSMWLLHVLLGHYHRVPLFKEEVEGGQEHNETDAVEMNIQGRSADQGNLIFGVPGDGCGVDETKIATVRHKESTISASDDPNDGTAATVKFDYPPRLIPQNPMLIPYAPYKPHRHLDTMYPIVKDDTESEPQTQSSMFTMVFDVSYLHTIPIRKHIYLSATLSLIEDFSAFYSWTRNNYTPCKIEHYVHGTLWDRYIEPSRAWPYAPSDPALIECGTQYFTPHERAVHNSNFMQRVHQVVLTNSIFDSGQEPLDEFIAYLDSHPTWAFEGGWNSSACMHILASIWDPTTHSLTEKYIWVPDAEQFWGANVQNWAIWQCQLNLTEEQAPGVAEAKRLINPLWGAEAQEGIDWLTTAFSNVLSNPQLLEEMGRAITMAMADQEGMIQLQQDQDGTL
jgi:hypothetical protein